MFTSRQGVSAVERASRTNPAPSPSETLIARNAPTLVFGGVIPSRCKPERIHRACCWAVSDVPKNPSLLLNGELFRTAKTVCSSDSGAQLDLTPSETMTRARVFHFQPCSTALLRPSRRVSSGSRKTLRPCYVSRFRGFWLRYRRSQQVVPNTFGRNHTTLTASRAILGCTWFQVSIMFKSCLFGGGITRCIWPAKADTSLAKKRRPGIRLTGTGKGAAKRRRDTTTGRDLATTPGSGLNP